MANSSVVVAGADALASQYNDLRKDALFGGHYVLSGAANAFAFTADAQYTAYVTGTWFVLQANFAITGAATLNVSGLGAKTIKKHGGLADVAAGDIVNGQEFLVVYDGTYFQMLSAPQPLTTKGDILAASGSGGAARLAAGSNSMVPIYDSAQALGLRTGTTPSLLGVLNTPVTVSNTTTKTTLFSANVPANLLSTGNAAKMRFLVSDLDIGGSSSDDLTLRLEYGSTVIASLSILDATSLLADFAGWIEVLLTATGATNSQKGSIEFTWRRLAVGSNEQSSNDTIDTSNFGNNRSFVFQFATGTAAEDSTTTLALKVTAQWGAASVNNSITAQHGVCEVLGTV